MASHGFYDPLERGEIMRRVCFFGGPGAGKSTLAMGLASRLKAKGLTAEYVSEFVKGWAYQGIPIKGFDQVYILASQMRLEEIVLRSNPKITIVSDCPLLQTIAYAIKYDVECWRSLVDIAMMFEKTYPALNILVRRHDLTYQTGGRYETHQQAIEMDERTKDLAREAGIQLHEFSYDDIDKIEDEVIKGMDT